MHIHAHACMRIHVVCTLKRIKNTNTYKKWFGKCTISHKHTHKRGISNPCKHKNMRNHHSKCTAIFMHPRHKWLVHMQAHKHVQIHGKTQGMRNHNNTLLQAPNYNAHTIKRAAKRRESLAKKQNNFSHWFDRYIHVSVHVFGLTHAHGRIGIRCQLHLCAEYHSIIDYVGISRILEFL